MHTRTYPLATAEALLRHAVAGAAVFLHTCKHTRAHTHTSDPTRLIACLSFLVD